MDISQLSLEVHARIATNLSVVDIARTGQVCKLWHAFYSSSDVWKPTAVLQLNMREADHTNEDVRRIVATSLGKPIGELERGDLRHYLEIPQQEKVENLRYYLSQLANEPLTTQVFLSSREHDVYESMREENELRIRDLIFAGVEVYSEEPEDNLLNLAAKAGCSELTIQTLINAGARPNNVGYWANADHSSNAYEAKHNTLTAAVLSIHSSWQHGSYDDLTRNFLCRRLIKVLELLIAARARPSNAQNTSNTLSCAMETFCSPEVLQTLEAAGAVRDESSGSISDLSEPLDLDTFDDYEYDKQQKEAEYQEALRFHRSCGFGDDEMIIGTQEYEEEYDYYWD